ncbi:motility associated factor glycosyltransferase family protein [Campylobacter novaezeelandiae]|uniref:motility associated factor glycosyltransferase family protein n=1 Tax=Campylobacter novaezeelandiae TaxID=2267891 RepID=UPI002D7EDCDF|nr:motility associated factor glycosyltransferase family protein [Campylobacter novaezeelandiae]
MLILWGGGKSLYKDVLSELNEKLIKYQTHFAFYPILYFYGFGNGVLLKALLQNTNHRHIIVFEKELEILYIVFHLFDFSSFLKEQRLIIFYTDKMSINDYANFCSTPVFVRYAKVYHLELMSEYYFKFQEDILKVNETIMSYFKKEILTNGNDPKDVLMGLENFIINLPKMITRPSFKNLIQDRCKSFENAIIVSTGPSLTKQLPLLKENAKKAIIFCADSAYPILAKEGIKPDYVCMVERTDFTAEFFNNDFKEFDKDITFILAGVVSPKACEFLEKNNRSFMLIPRDYLFAFYLDLKPFSYAFYSVSVAHLAFVIALNLAFKNIIFIGQDLAFNDEGDSHPKDYKHTPKYESSNYKGLKALAYGGKTQAKTQEAWVYFKQVLEQMINEAKCYGIEVYNATEGGLRIEGSIEKPFSLCIKELLKDTKKAYLPLSVLSFAKQSEFLLKAFVKIIKSIKNCKKFVDKISQKIKCIEQSHLDLEQTKKIIKDLECLKQELFNFKDLLELLQPSSFQLELSLAKISVINVKNEEELLRKNLLFIEEFVEYFRLVKGLLSLQRQSFLKHICALENELIKRGFENKILKIKDNIC